MELARWTNAQVSKEFKTSVTCSDAGIHREVAKCVSILSRRLSTIKVTGSEVAL